ncbi:MAG: alpha-amylase family glycosyl hydrolase [Proteiniphilum sp.]|nr:alpha-amylase family glycosyl hydrolase [Proteiniphilum sp.]
MNEKLFIYQLMPRLFANRNGTNQHNGSLQENGCGKFNDIGPVILNRLKNDGYTHIWYIGVPAHASVTDYSRYGIPEQYPEIIKGKAGSPYAIRDYYDVDPDLAEDVSSRMQEFEALVERTHHAGLKVIIDHVPNHVARNYHSVYKPVGVRDFGEDDDRSVAFSPNNNFYYLPGHSLQVQLPPDKKANFTYHESPARATGNDCFTHTPTIYDWYETVKLNYGVDYLNGMIATFDPIPDTWIKMRNILLYWASKKVDGFRCDMAEMVPLSFWQWVIPQVKEHYPAIIFLAEIYNPSAYRDFLGENLFDYLYDKVGLYDLLREVSNGYRPASDITFTLNEVGDIQKRMLNFMENHDEQRIASDYFLREGHRGKAAMIVTSTVNSNPVMVFNGQELGERGMDNEGFSGLNGRTTIFDYWSVDTLQRWNNNGQWDSQLLTPYEQKLQSFYRRLITLCNEEEALSSGLFYDLMPANYENQDFDSTRLFAYLRGGGKDLLLVIVNFDPSPRECTLHIPEHAFDYFGIVDSGEGKLTPLLQKEGESLLFTYHFPYHVKLEGYGGEIYRVTFL